MPLWTIYHTPGIFAAEEKQQLATWITEHYAQVGLPRFYVVTIFNESRAEDFYVGGEPAPVGVRVVIDHIARHNPDRASRRRTARWINDMLRPYLKEKTDLHWELHVDETSEDLWLINGLIPPPAKSEAEQAWAKTNAATTY